MGFYTAVAAAGVAAKAGSQFMAGKAAEDDAKTKAMFLERDAAAKDQDAIASVFKTTFDQIARVLHGDRVVSSLRARLGASGAMVSQGAPDNILAAQAVQNAHEVAIVGHTGQTRTEQLKSEAANLRLNAVFVKQRGKAAKRMATTQAIGSLFAGAGQMHKMGRFDKLLNRGGSKAKFTDFKPPDPTIRSSDLEQFG